MKLLFATNNENKVKEVQALLGKNYEIMSLKAAGIHVDIPEEQPTLEGNARFKARFIYERFQMPCFADDTGLEVAALNGAPGVHSARYAGLERSDAQNIAKVLKELSAFNDRSARFRTVIALKTSEVDLLFEGKVDGQILEAPVGEDGFGYDPVFLPKGHTKSFAQMTLTEKNKLSHRARAMDALMTYLNSI